MRPNAADKKQQAEKEERDALQERLAESDLKYILGLKQGRRFIWRLLARGKMFGSVLSQSGTQVYVNAGQQDFVRRLWAECEAADQGSLFSMMTEAKADRDAEARDSTATTVEEKEGD